MCAAGSCLDIERGIGRERGKRAMVRSTHISLTGKFDIRTRMVHKQIVKFNAVPPSRPLGWDQPALYPR